MRRTTKNQTTNILLPVASIVSMVFAGTAILQLSQASTNPAAPPATSQNANNNLPSSASNNCCEITINNASTSVSDRKHLALSITLKNLTSQTIQISPGLQMYITDANGAKYSYTAEFKPAGVVIGGPLAANSSTTLDLDFVMPSQANPRTFSFQQDASSPVLILGLPQ
jgi:hypothetical protein